MSKKFLAEFANPQNHYRAAPFWAWNGQLEPEELRRQIRLMRRMGMGGFFMHSRVGLDTAYLGKEWMDCVAACVDEAEKLDMDAWLYDEDRWPSGAAGGLVTKNPKYRQRRLSMEKLDKPTGFRWTPEVLAAFAGGLDNHVLRNVRRLEKGRRPVLADGEVLLVFRDKTQACSSWYNGYTYLDTMNHEAVREFLRVTHEAYRKRFGKEFGKRIPGIFTDEPNHGGHSNDVFTEGRDVAIPWTGKLPAVFRKRYGYDLLDHLPELFYEIAGLPASQARWAYHDCTTFLFVDAFARQIGEWCAKNNMLHTGHVLMEETLGSQTSVVGSAMRFYEFMQAPGMDLLTEHSREYDTAKQVSSAAHQFGLKWRLTETYGCTGWDFDFAGHKALSDWQAALGINLRCPHLSWYTMEGEAKRDYPAGIFYQSPWWDLYPKVEDYFARVHVAMTRGREVRDLLVVHPVESAWVLFSKGATERREVVQDMFWRLRDTLLSAHLDFDYGDEDILARHGKVAKRQGRPVLVVAKAEYQAVVVPAQLTIRGTTLELLRKFQAAGGKVVFAGDPPTLVDAVESCAAAELAKVCTRTPAAGPQLAKAVEAEARRLSITDAQGQEIPAVLYGLREDRDAWYLFICNTSEPNVNQKAENVMVRDRQLAYPDVRVKVLVAAAGQPVEIDCDTGATYAAAAREVAGGWEIGTALPAIASRLFVLPKAKSAETFPKRPAFSDVSREALNPGTWQVILSEPNVAVLDRPRFRLGQGDWQPADDILFVDRAAREKLGIPHRGGQMKQPWAREKPAQLKRLAVTLEYEFQVEAPPSGQLYLALEQPRTFQVKLNGQPVDTDVECGWWVDRSLKKLPLEPAFLTLGRNRLELICDYTELHPGFEIVYLLGTFGTRAAGTQVTLTAPPSTLKLGDWVEQGLTFYSGSVSYVQAVQPRLNPGDPGEPGERLVVEVPDYRGAAVRVLVNGQPAGIIGWQPQEVDVTELVRAAGGQPVALAIEVIGHRRNSHGPLHLTEKWPRWTGPAQFTDRAKWFEGYQLVPCGLLAAPQLVVRK